jgi:hypothetical protein
MRKLFTFIILIVWILTLYSIRASAQAPDTVTKYITIWDFTRITKDTTFTQSKAGLSLLETPNNEEWEVTVSYKKKVVVPPTPVITTVEDILLQYSGAWTNASGAWGSVSFSSQAGATAKYSFTGNRVQVIADKAMNHGEVGIKINNNSEEIINLYSPTRINGVVVYDKVIPLGFHTIVFRVISNTVLIDKLITTR